MILTKNKKNKFSLLLVLFLSFGLFFLAQPAQANWASDIIGGLIGMIIGALGVILALVMEALIAVAQYSSFINAKAIEYGWTIVRDVCNMFFVLILLIIAFATILKIENYSYKKWLPKLILMAILINFSKTICGLLIDFAQIVMLTFVNAFKDIAAGNLIQSLGITEILKLANNSADVGAWEIIGAYVLGLIYILIALVVIITILAMLVMRIIMIWIYVVLSPAAYLMSAFPGGQKYASQWWSEFSKNLIVGPVLAFFIWLSFVSLQATSTNEFPVGSKDTAGVAQEAGVTLPGEVPYAGSAASTPDMFIKFVIAIGMLIGGLKISQEIGGAAGGIAGKGMAKISSGAAFVGGAVTGGVATVTGYNFAKRRFGEFKKEAQHKMQQRSDLVYDTVKGNIVGAGKGVLNLSKKGFSDLGSGIANKVDPKKTARNKVNQFVNKTFGTKETRQETRRQEKARLDAYNDQEKIYRDKNGVEYKENGNHYEREVKDKNGKTVMENGKAKIEIARDQKGNIIRKMDETEAIFQSSLRDGQTKSRALRNQIKEERMGKKQKLLEDSGADIGDLKRVMKDKNLSNDKRLAAAMTLAIKDGFKNKDLAAGRRDVAQAKNIIGNNGPLLKKFNETINKKFAHLNYDLDGDLDGSKNEEKNEIVRNQFKQDMESGYVDGYSLDSTAYSNATMQKVLKEHSGIDYVDNIQRVSQRSRSHRNAVGEGVVEAKEFDLAHGGQMINQDGKVNEYAALIAKLTGNMEAAFSENKDGSREFNREAATEYFARAKAADMKSFDPSQLKIKTDANGQTNEEFIEKLQYAIARGMDVNTLTQMARSDQSPELIARIIDTMNSQGDRVIKANKPDDVDKRILDKVDEIEKNNILKNYTPKDPTK